MRHEACRSIRDMLVAFADGELPSADSARVESHVASCPACRRELSSLRRSLELARADWQTGLLRPQVAALIFEQQEN